MRIRTAIAACLAAAALAAVLPAAAQQSEPSFPDQLIEGIRGLFKSIFGGGDDKPAPAAGEAQPAQVPQDPTAAGAPKESPKEAMKPAAEPQPVAATPSAQTVPLSLHAVVAKGDYETARKLVEQGADIEAKDPGTGASVLHYAVMRGNPEIIQMLIGRGADLNSRTKNGTTPLHTAVLYNRYEIAETLLNRGAEIDAKSASGATPLALAAAAKNRTIAELLRSRGAH